MSISYDNLQYDVSTIFRDIILKVESNIVSESTLSIDRVGYFCETWEDLCIRLQSKDKAGGYKYPLIALIRNSDEKMDDDFYPKISPTLVIVTPTQKDKLSEDRIVDNFTPILMPIYTELMEVLSQSRYFQGYYNPYPKHKMFKSFNLGDDNGGKGLKLPDTVDAIVVTDLELRLNRPVNSAFTYGTTRTLTYLNNLSEIEINAVNNRITVEIISHGFYYPGHTATYTVYFSHNSSTNNIDIGQGYPFTISASQGAYYGYVQAWDGRSNSQLGFFYWVDASGNIIKYTTSHKFAISNFTVTGMHYPDYPFTCVFACGTNAPSIMAQTVTVDYEGEVHSDSWPTPISDMTEEQIQCPNTDTNYKGVTEALTHDAPHNTTLVVNSFSYFQVT